MSLHIAALCFTIFPLRARHDVADADLSRDVTTVIHDCPRRGHATPTRRSQGAAEPLIAQAWEPVHPTWHRACKDHDPYTKGISRAKALAS